MTIEEKVASTILQKHFEVKVGDKTYVAAPPSIATLILVSEAVSQLPQALLDKERLVEDSLSFAKDSGKFGDIIAILILGAKHLTERVKRREIVSKRLLWGLFRRKTWAEKEITVDRKAELSKEVLENLSPAEVLQLTATLLQRMELGDFFALSTFLTGINLMRPTKVETGATASGQ